MTSRSKKPLLLERFRQAVADAGTALDAHDLADAAGISIGHCRTEVGRRVGLGHMYVAAETYDGKRLTSIRYRVGAKPEGFVVDRVQVGREAPPAPVNSRWPSVWHYAAGVAYGQ